MSRRLAAVLAVAVSSVALPAGAQAVDARPRGARQHDGFFVQVQAGMTYLDLRFTDEDYFDGNVYGVGSGMVVAVGSAPMNNLVIFGEIAYQGKLNPHLKVGGSKYDFGDDNIADIDVYHLGPGLAYYLGESNFFLSSSIVHTHASFGSDIIDVRADGIGIRSGVGKEWWIGNQWGVGLGANFFLAGLTNDIDRSAVRVMLFSVNVSGTYQ